SGWPTGATAPGTETRIVGTSALGTSDLVAVGPSGNGILHQVEIRNFTFDSGPARGNDLSFNRTQGYSVHENAFTGGVTANGFFNAANGVFSVASSGTIVGNHFSANAAGAGIAAGYPPSPSSVQVVRNRLAPHPASPPPPPST